MSRPLRVLLIGDSEEDAMRVLRVLRAGEFAPEHRRVDSPTAMAAALGDKPWDVVVSDYTMPKFSGLDALALLQKSGLGAPFIFVANPIGEEAAVNCIHAGAADFMIKERLDRLPSAVRRALAADGEHRKRFHAEQQLAASERRLRTIFESEPECVKLLGPDCTLQEMNPAGLRMIEADSLEQVVGHCVLDLILPKYRTSFAQLSERVMRGETGTLEFEIQGLKGSHRWLETRAVPMRDAQGRVDSLLGITRDISGRKQAEEALRASEERFRDLFEHSPDAIFVESHEGIVLDVNSAACQLHGLTRGQLLGRHVLDLVPPTERESVERGFSKLTTGEIVNMEGFSWTADGRAVPVEITSKQIAFSSQPALLLHVRDITERKRVENILAWEKGAMELISSGAPLGVVLEALVRGLEQQTPGSLCSILLLDADGKHLRHGAAPSLPDAYNRAIDGITIGPVVGSCGTAAYANRQVIVADIGSDPLWADYAGLALGHGLRACWSTPIHSGDGKVIATFAIYHREPQQPVPADLALIERATHVVSLAIERKQAEAAVQTSQRMLQLVLDNIPQGVFWKDRESRYIGCNSTIVRHRGVANAEALKGKSDREFGSLAPEQAEYFIQKDLEVMTSGRPQLGIIEQTTRADGSVHWLETNKVPLHDTEGNVIGVLGTWQDITARRQAEEAAQASQRMLQLVLNNIPQGVFWKDCESRYLGCNEIVARNFGIGKPESIVGMTDHDFAALTPEQAEFFVRKDREVMTSGQPQLGIIEQATMADGSTRWLETNKVPLFDTAGKVMGILGTWQDVTERKQNEESLRMMRFSVDRAGDGIVWVSREGCILYANDAMCAGRGYSREELLGMRIFDLDPDYHPGVWEPHFEELKRRGTITLETRHRAKDGRVFPIEVSANYVFINGQEFNFATVRDITDRRKQERIAFRSQRMESIGTLAGGIAHDLNNALAPIMMSGELLRMEYPRESPMLDRIEASAERAADMVRQLLTFAKGAEGARVSVQPGRLLREMENMIKGSFPKNIMLAVKCDPVLPVVLGDATQLHQVLLNLCVNARDAMPRGGMLTLEAGDVELGASDASSIHDATPGRYVALNVRDTGEGIPAEILDRIFDPFFTTKDPDKGTGLGLSTVLGIVKGHGGFTQVSSQPGEGSTFTVYLPVDPAGSEPAPVAKAEGAFRGRGETILFVDDEALVRNVARAVLQHLNFNPLIATDGVDALMQASQHRTEIRAIITDLHMPRMDGIAFVREVRRLLPDIPIMVASGRMEDDDFEALAKLGVMDRLDKPFTQAHLAEALKIMFAPK